MIPMPNNLAPGVRQASDFLMALQLTGAAKTQSIANLMVRLPVVVIGGGLTAIDTATELLAYYPVQVEKFLARYETLSAERGEAAVRAEWNPAESEAAAEFLGHARALRAERDTARREGRPARVAELLDGWGGVTIAYRRRLIDAPSYTLNHEEVAKAMEEGIRFAELLTPEAVETDRFGQAAALRLRRTGAAEGQPETVVLPARTILVAAGTQPNTVLAREDPANIVLDGRHFQALDEAGNPAVAGAGGETIGGPDPDPSALGRARRQLFRRPASEFFGERRQGDGRRHPGLPGGQPDPGAPPAVGPGAGAIAGPARRRIARPGSRRSCG